MTTRDHPPAEAIPGEGLYVVHIALQGCLKPGDIDYGCTVDTGGHIRYLLDQIRALQAIGVQQAVVTRAFDEPALGATYARIDDELLPGVPLHRLRGQSSAYLAKEALYTEHDVLAERLAEWLSEQPRRPDVLHAHYGDAGALARRMRKRLGLPYIFTAHSLGAVKARWLAIEGASVNPTRTASLTRRIDIEQSAIHGADLIVASSADEARQQYGLYQPAGRRLSICVNAPGCELGRFSSADTQQSVGAALEAAFETPGKPILLCLARPVWRKNLLGVIEAYAGDAALQARANLAIFAGASHAAAREDDESRAVLAALAARIADYGLEGQIALPASHRAEDVPAIYQYVAAGGGVFVNAAFHEPFGLTLVEAAAAGLPVVATDQGGARDIVAECDNGQLVAPRDTAAIAEAARTLLADRLRWRYHARSGRIRVQHFDWARHARQYVNDWARHACRTARSFTSTGGCGPANEPRLFVADMDDTLLGDAAGLAAFGRWQAAHPDICFAVATGRSAIQAQIELDRWDAPRPDVLIASGGAEIHWPNLFGLKQNTGGRWPWQRCDPAWHRLLAPRWDRAGCRRALADCPGLCAQPTTAQRPLKLGYIADDGPAVAAEARRRLVQAGLDAEVIDSHGCYIDVVAPGANKNDAARYVARRLNLSTDTILAAGNAGNDVDLLLGAAGGIAVGNCDADIRALRASSRLYFATGEYASGVVEGLTYWLSPRGAGASEKALAS